MRKAGVRNWRIEAQHRNWSPRNPFRMWYCMMMIMMIIIMKEEEKEKRGRGMRRRRRRGSSSSRRWWCWWWRWWWCWGRCDCEKVLILLREFPCFLMNFHLWTDPLCSRTPFGWHHKCCHLYNTKIYFNSSTQKKDKSLNDWRWRNIQMQMTHVGSGSGSWKPWTKHTVTATVIDIEKYINTDGMLIT